MRGSWISCGIYQYRFFRCASVLVNVMTKSMPERLFWSDVCQKLAWTVINQPTNLRRRQYPHCLQLCDVECRQGNSPSHVIGLLGRFDIRYSIVLDFVYV